MDEYSVVLEGVGKRFGETEVLGGVTATLRRGSITAFVGPNGAGKTTLFNAITGELKVDSGWISIAGKDTSRLSPSQIAALGVGKVFQDVRLFPTLSVIDNVAAAILSSRDQTLVNSLIRGEAVIQEARERGQLVLREIGVQDPFDVAASALSWGNQKLVAFARLLAAGCSVALLDEPVAGVAPAMGDRLKALIRRMASEKGMTVGLIEHNMDFVIDLADWVVVLKDGRVVDQGSPQEILKSPRNVELLCGL